MEEVGHLHAKVGCKVVWHLGAGPLIELQRVAPTAGIKLLNFLPIVRSEELGDDFRLNGS